MPTPPKPFTVLTGEKKSHRTKAELDLRKQGEEELMTGVSLKETAATKRNPIAHKEFVRINKLLKSINKNDAIYEGVINRYCVIFAECQGAEVLREDCYNMMVQLKEQFEIANEDSSGDERAEKLILFTREIAKMHTSLVNMDRDLQSKRKMLLDMEKENVMTIASALRSIPKKVTENKDALLEALK